MQILLKNILVWSSFFLLGLVVLDMQMGMKPGESFRLFPVLFALWMTLVFFCGWSILLGAERHIQTDWKKGYPLALGAVVWTWFFMDENFLSAFLIFSVIVFLSYFIAQALPYSLVFKSILWIFPWFALVSFLLSVLVIVYPYQPGSFLFLLAVIPAALFFGIAVPSGIVLFPLYVWVFGIMRIPFLSWRGAALIFFPIVMFVWSDYGRSHILVNSASTFADPCYEVIEGKMPEFVIKGDRVCVVDRELYGGKATLKTLEGADLNEYKKKDEETRLLWEQNQRDYNKGIPSQPRAPRNETVQQLSIPFTVQAPKGQWNRALFQDGCEEASALMAAWWAEGKAVILPEEAEQEMYMMTRWEEDKRFGVSVDLSPEDVVVLLREYWGQSNVEVKDAIGKVDIIDALYAGAVVIVPTDGKALHNPFYTAGGPDRHMLVIIGYDPVAKQFITNDPGTKHGEKYRYDEDILYTAIRAYSTGDHLPIVGDRKAMVVVR